MARKSTATPIPEVRIPTSPIIPGSPMTKKAYARARAAVRRSQRQKARRFNIGAPR
jgi:hypothetical protein